MIALRSRDQHVCDPRPLPHETEAETKTNYCETETETETKKVVSRPQHPCKDLVSSWLTVRATLDHQQATTGPTLHEHYYEQHK